MEQCLDLLYEHRAIALDTEAVADRALSAGTIPAKPALVI